MLEPKQRCKSVAIVRRPDLPTPLGKAVAERGQKTADGVLRVAALANQMQARLERQPVPLRVLTLHRNGAEEARAPISARRSAPLASVLLCCNRTTACAWRASINAASRPRLDNARVSQWHSVPVSITIRSGQRQCAFTTSNNASGSVAALPRAKPLHRLP